MAQLTALSSSLFATDTESTSAEVNTTASNLQRFFGVSFPAQGQFNDKRLLGYIWAEARDNLTNWQQFATLPVLYRQRPIIYLPDYLLGCVWRLRYIPLESTPPGNGNFVLYRMQ